VHLCGTGRGFRLVAVFILKRWAVHRSKPAS
jgi:hypothetical protein